MYKHSKESQTNLTPEQAFNFLKEGNERFVQNLRANRDLLQQVNATRDGQYPFATILSCMDSRTSAELIFDQGLGDIFSIRIAGNIVNDDIIGSMEFATQVVGTKVIVVLGHTRCGAIVGACNNVELGSLTQLLKKIKPAIEAEKETKTGRDGKNASFVNNVTALNVKMAMKEIPEKSSVITNLLSAEKIKIAGGIYNVETGRIDFFD